ncbi:MAG TPA: Rrf2 family transcriptional regulator [Vicinamibacterales bacterium]|jgi:Rrf2 family protein|nr:Rrf2 family transcriptional regulator [Vicinamibacterales bacterium]|tara:strand:- start:118 stop:546 length:429 start_codon:yes stop_codon:yes gene_type:complete
MLISQTAEYALRAMVWIVAVPPKRAVGATELSAGTDISVHYLRKILRRLVLAGMLTSQRGIGGGFRLARSPGEIRIIDILVAVDADPRTDHCAFGWGTCDSSKTCPLHDLWSSLRGAVLDWANNTTLDEVREPSLVNGHLMP